MARTTKPCPGCGQIDSRRQADKVCRTCETKLSRVAEIEAEAVQLRAQVAKTLATETEPHPIHVPARCYMVGVHRALYESEDYQRFADATVAMIKALVAPLDRGRKLTYDAGYDAIPASNPHGISASEFHGYAEVSKDAAKIAQAWWRAIGEWSQVCYGVGVKDGQDLLGQLAAGEMTVGQVNDRVYEITTRKRAR